MLYSNFMSLRRLVVVFTLVVAMCQHIAAGMQSTRICSQMTRSQSYDMHGWLREWNTPFVSQQLRYADGANPSYSGRVSAKITGSYGISDRYDYSYDRLGRLISADFSREMPQDATAKDGDADYSTIYSYDFAAGDPIDSTEIKCCIVRKTI